MKDFKSRPINQRVNGVSKLAVLVTVMFINYYQVCVYIFYE